MPVRDGYIPGVPCWVEASEPDPEAALDFYGGLFGWEFEDVMPLSSEGKYFIARAEARGSSIFDL
jgi:predicted enzyme related to lactoylglutathione lyase